MPVSYQIVPEHPYPSQVVQINDNTEVTPTYATSTGGVGVLCVAASPKGKDGVVTTIPDGLKGFMDEVGLGPFELYGQPLLNAYQAASSGATLHFLRISAADAVYSNTHLIALYKVDDVTKKMTIKFVNATDPALTNLSTLGDFEYTKDVADADFTAVKLFSIAYNGKGIYGDNLRWRIVSDATADKQNIYKNYTFYLYANESGLSQKEYYAGTFVPDAIGAGQSIFFDALLGDDDTGSRRLRFVSFAEGFKDIYDAYKAANPETALSFEDFDVLLGIDKYTKEKIVNLDILAESSDNIVVNTLMGITFGGGSDGAFGADQPAATRKAAMEAAYAAAYSGDLDPYIKSKNKFPTTLLPDAGFSTDIKKTIAQLGKIRGDTMVLLDLGTELYTKTAAMGLGAALEATVDDRIHFIDAYAGKVTDPYSGKNVTVTSTYGLIGQYLAHFRTYGNKNKPLAGNQYGAITGYVKGSLYPVYDPDIDSAEMTKLTEAHINFLKTNPSQTVVRAIQDTRQDKKTVLSEISNMFTLLDIKRDFELLVSQLEFDYTDASNMGRFNLAADNIAEKYKPEVASITAAFSQNAWEVENSVLHLNIAFSTRGLVKHSIVEIDINR